MAAAGDVMSALQTLTAQINALGDRIQELELNQGEAVTPQQLDARSAELRNLSAQAVLGVERAVADLRMRGADAHASGSRINLINDKYDAPQHFGGDKHDHLQFRGWSKKITNYLNSRRRGFRQVLDWAKDFGLQPITQHDVFSTEWSDRQDGNAALYDFWLKILHGEALLIVEQAVDNGLEGFRLLHQEYDPAGAQHDLER